MHCDLTDKELAAIRALDDVRQAWAWRGERRPVPLKMVYGVTWAALEGKGLILALDESPWFALTEDGEDLAALMRGEYTVAAAPVHIAQKASIAA